jgi:hypothetical protein
MNVYITTDHTGELLQLQPRAAHALRELIAGLEEAGYIIRTPLDASVAMFLEGAVAAIVAHDAATRHKGDQAA